MRQISILVLGLAVTAQGLLAQFSSGSTGSDGAYSPTTSGVFDPVALGLDPSGDNVFNFTTITIPSNVTITLTANKLRNKPVTWLASGNVSIAGTLSLSGASGNQLAQGSQTLVANRVPSEPGPGGYPGGLGSQGGVGPQAGAGPGGGLAGLQNSSCVGGDGSFISSGNNRPGPTYGSYILVPLYGGSGGGGGWDNTTGQNVGGIGGAGGGGIRIVSSTQITVNGQIYANGGGGGYVSLGGCQGGQGAGGAIHLIAPTISGSGSLSATSLYETANGIVRFSTNTNSFTGGSNPAILQGSLYIPPANSSLPLPSLLITQVNGVAVPSTAAGLFLSPDVIINATGAVTVNIAASNIPLGTVVSLHVTAQTVGDSTISCTPLAGTFASSTATCSASFPYAVSIAIANATW